MFVLIYMVLWIVIPPPMHILPHQQERNPLFVDKLCATDFGHAFKKTAERRFALTKPHIWTNNQGLIHAHTDTHVYMNVCTCMNVFSCSCVYAYGCTCVCVGFCVCLGICICVCIRYTLLDVDYINAMIFQLLVCICMCRQTQTYTNTNA